MVQLSIFDLEEELVTETLSEQENQKMKSVVTLASNTKNEEASKFIAGDKVKIILIAEEIDSETHHYRKYYEPHLIGKVGEVINIVNKKNRQCSYEVNVYGTVSVFDEEELVWIG